MSDIEKLVKDIFYHIMREYGLIGVLVFAGLGLLAFLCLVFYRYLKAKKIIKTGGVEGRMEELKSDINRKFNHIENTLIEIKNKIKRR